MESKFGWQRHPSPTADDDDRGSSNDQALNNLQEEYKNSSDSSDNEDPLQKLSHLKKDTSKM